ncbi:Uncharacterised protein [Klebsiella variicola]|nr:Uncharacterised protein [Klebsiella variicola]
MTRQYCLSLRSFSAARAANPVTACCMSVRVSTRWPNERDTTICCFAGGFSPRLKQASPRNSRTVLSSTTPNVLRIRRVSALAKSSTVLIPIVASAFSVRWPTPQTSATGRMLINFFSLAPSSRATTPPVAGHVFAAWLHSFASVLVRAIPTPHTSVVCRLTSSRSWRPESVKAHGGRYPFAVNKKLVD